MAIDTLARGMAANASGGGGGGVDVGIEAGVGIRFGGTDPVEIINTGVTAVTTPGSSGADVDAPLGSVKVSNPGALNSADRVHYVVPKGLDNAAFKDVDTEINSSVATSTNLPTTKAVYDELEKKVEADLDTTAFTNDNDHVPSSKLVKEKLDDKLDTTTTINGVSVSSGSYTLDGDDIDVTGYTAISSGTEEDVTATDSVNDAIAKVEYKADNRIPTDNIDTDFPVSPDATHVLASTIASATFQGTGTVGVSPKKGLVPAPSTTSGTETRYLKADGTWDTPPNSEYSAGTGVDISNAGVISNTGVTHIENSDPADDNVGNGTFKVVENGTAKWIAIKGLDDAAYMDVVTSIPATPLDTDLPTSQAVAKYVDDAIDALPKPMVFKGGITLTADSTDTTLCSLTLPSGITTIKEGYTFKVVAIASSPVYTGNIKVGDTLYANKDNAKTTADWVVDTDWTITPSGDEPSGTVTEVAATDGITTASGSAISSTGTVKLNMVSSHTITGQSASAITTTANRTYPVGLDANNKVAVNIPWENTTYEFADSYNASTNKGATVATVTNAIGALDVSGTTTFGAGKTISSWSETDGKVNITSQDISITGSQISDIDTTMPATAVDTKVPSTKLVKTQLSGKQNTLTFDGTYNASTNKAATVSTVTNAINALDVTEVTVGSTKTINKISQTDGKISVSTTDIRSASTSQTGLVQLNDAIDNTSTAQAATANAVKKVNDKVTTCETNILYNLNMGVKNILPDLSGTYTASTSTYTWNSKGEIHFKSTDSSTHATDIGTFALKAGTYVLDNRVVYSSGGAVQGDIRFSVNGESVTPNITSVFTLSQDSIVTVKAYTYGIVDTTITPLLCTKAAWDQSHDYQPPALPNYDLTRMMTPFFTVPINHNMIYRGQNLGETFTEEQHTALSSGNFTDLYLGDYWTKTVTIPAGTYTGGDGQEVTVPAQTNITLKAVIADFDTFYAGYASTYAGINTHHAAVIVTGFSNVVWNKTNSTAGGYVASLIHKWLVGSALPQIETWFGSAKVLSHQKLLTNAITGDAASGWAWSSQKISLLSENQMYDSKVWGGSKATNGGYEPGEAFKHLNVFNHIDANLLFGNKNIWLRDIASAEWSADLSSGGTATGNDASHTGIAPAALILLS